MAKLTVEDLSRIKAHVLKETSLRRGTTQIRITVHMGTCGIAAGARDVMTTVIDEIAAAGRSDIRVVSSGCIGMCSSEPNVTVEIEGRDPIVYRQVDVPRMRQIFRRHILLGEVQTAFALAKL